MSANSTPRALSAGLAEAASEYFADSFEAELLRNLSSKRLRERIAAIPESKSIPAVSHPFSPPQPEEYPAFPKHILIGGIRLVLAAGALVSRRRRYWDEW